MKLIYEHSEVHGEVVEELNESTGKSSKTYYLTGTFSTIGEKNRNGRIYPKHIWETEVSKYQNEISGNSINTLMEWEHPERSFVDPLSAVSKIVSLTIEGNKVIGKAKLLNNEKANQLKNLIDEGISIGVSSRGVGSVGKNGMVETFKLITYDCVAQPSDFNANTTGITESIQDGILLTEEYDIVDDKIVKVKIFHILQQLVESVENVEEAILSKFEKLFDVNEATLKKDSIMFNGAPSAELQVSGRESNVISLWVNGGTAYEFESTPEFGLVINGMKYPERKKLGQDIALKVAKLIEKEITDLEKKLK